MPRIRTIKPEMPSDEALAQCSRDARLTFVYLITQADDYGLQLATARQLLGALFPHDADVTEAMVVGWCDELARVGVVRWRKTGGGSPVLEVVHWGRHQTVKHPSRPVIGPMLSALADTDSARISNYSTHPPEILPQSSGGSPESLPHQPTTNYLGPRTMDLGPTTTATTANIRRLVIAANKGTTEQFGEQPTPFTVGHGGSTACAEELAAAGVPIDFAERSVFTLASTVRPADGKPPRSLRYFATATVAAWEAEQAHREAATAAAPTAPKGDPNDPRLDLNYHTAVRYAKLGNPEWQEWCTERGVDWAAA